MHLPPKNLIFSGGRKSRSYVHNPFAAHTPALFAWLIWWCRMVTCCMLLQARSWLQQHCSISNCLLMNHVTSPKIISRSSVSSAHPLMIDIICVERLPYLHTYFVTQAVDLITKVLIKLKANWYIRANIWVDNVATLW